ncbi:zinc metalloprotease HtpX [Sulfurospirillum halorespirans]|uniref:Protease HtpX homolog n=1 Tax=Sulfurospirillum halorespirans DSM 13726 TaxID=1193502 RepID=A0A1D7TIN4_9BACT|nr:zinc metalloprotease HtpX [Sulfurospirillum halorespirans]AOO64869.1 protease HtpX-like protein [Sulfurospirillum halorespirans DSM 13726]
MEVVKTVVLLTLMSVLFVWVGGMMGGTQGMMIALVLAGVMNFVSYFYSDTLVLRHYNAVPVTREAANGLYIIVERLSQKANLPLPQIYIIPDSVPNAFATGRNPSHAAVAVTEGLLQLLDDEEVEAVLAHELSHVRHYDILVGTIAATIAGAIGVIANMMQFGAMFGGSRENRPNPIVMIALAIILPLAAAVIQMAISRNREYMADEGSARLTAHPEWLQSALAKLSSYNAQGMVHEATPESAHMFIINPFAGKHISFASLFSTHPSTEDRIARLEELKFEIK